MKKIKPINLNFFSVSEIVDFCKLSSELHAYLSKKPDEWSKYQSVFDSAVGRVSQKIQQIEIENLDNKPKLDGFKKIFAEKYRDYFLHGEFVKRSFKKPFGYPGDFKIIDDIYQNQPRTTGFDRLCDNYFLQLAASKATRERKEDFKKEISNFVNNRKNKRVRIMNLGSGSAREIKELLEIDYGKLFSTTVFDCYDFDIRAINYAKKLLNNINRINFFEKNAIRLALTKDIKKEIFWNYDLIYSAGLFDYFDEKFAIRLICNLKKLLKKDGVMLISNYREKFNNPSVFLMEWVSEWYLTYRTKDELKKIFLEASFSSEDLKIVPQRSKIMQYCFATIK